MLQARLPCSRRATSVHKTSASRWTRLARLRRTAWRKPTGGSTRLNSSPSRRTSVKRHKPLLSSNNLHEVARSAGLLRSSDLRVKATASNRRRATPADQGPRTATSQARASRTSKIRSLPSPRDPLRSVSDPRLRTVKRLRTPRTKATLPLNSRPSLSSTATKRLHRSHSTRAGRPTPRLCNHIQLNSSKHCRLNSHTRRARSASRVVPLMGDTRHLFPRPPHLSTPMAAVLARLLCSSNRLNSSSSSHTATDHLALSTATAITATWVIPSSSISSSSTTGTRSSEARAPSRRFRPTMRLRQVNGARPGSPSSSVSPTRALPA